MHHITNSSSRALRRAAAKAKQPLLARGAHKEVKFSNEGRASILKGVDVLADAVSVTLGPKGKHLQAFGFGAQTDATDTSFRRSQRHHRAAFWWPEDHQG